MLVTIPVWKQTSQEWLFFSFLCCLTWLYTAYGKQQTAIVGSCTPMIFSLRDKLLV
mgnify:CR=1 FL=1